MSALVSVVKVIKGSDAVFNAVSNAMQLADWSEHISGRKLFIKINGVSHLDVPGQNTSPWVIDALLRFFRENMESVELNIGDGNTSGRENFPKAVKLWRYDKIAVKYNANLVDLSKEEHVDLDAAGKVLDKVKLPKILLDSDALISVPVMKLHIEAILGCSLKNLFGCIPAPRHHYHVRLGEVITDIFEITKPNFTLVDGTVGIENGGPIVGKPKEADVIIASGDLVAADATACRIMDINPDSVSYLKECEKRGLGKVDAINIKGDSIPFVPFKRGSIGNITQWERRLRRTPLGSLIYKTWLSKPLSLYATYSLNKWYKKEGKK